MTGRLDSLRRRFAQEGIDALLVSQAENRRYLSGFTGSAGFLIISGADVLLATDSRYVEQARAESPALEVVQTRGELAAWLPGVLARLGIRALGFEAGAVSFAAYRQFAATVAKVENQLIPTEGLVESLRMVKDDAELACLIRASELIDAVYAYIISVIHPGMSEKEVAWQIEKFLRENGSETMPFEIIVASGPNSALPHARPTERLICDGEPVVLDLGAQMDGYCSDFTRTLCLGTQDSKFAGIYDLVLGAQLTALSTVEAGMTGAQADQLARTVIEQGGYGDFFGHGLGHGVGLNVHEAPRLGPNSSDILCDGMAFTIEPGVYLSGWGGVRIEDTAVLRGGKADRLTNAKK